MTAVLTTNPVMMSRSSTREPRVARLEALLLEKTRELMEFLQRHPWADFDQYEVFAVRMEYFKKITQYIDEELRDRPDELSRLQQLFRQESEPIFQTSGLMTRARSWPGGYPGDYETLEAIYNRTPFVEHGLGNYLDRYFLASTLAVAVRWRLRKLIELLNQRAETEGEDAVWLNVASGSCRELLSVPGKRRRTVWCLDSDARSLDYARNLLRYRYGGGERMEFVCQNALRLVRPDANRRQFGRITTCYSAGLFDYIDTPKLARLLGGLYQSLAEGGVLIATFKDCERYDTFDYHWLVEWHFFLQRTLSECYDVFDLAGIPREQIRMERDATGVILFFLVTKM